MSFYRMFLLLICFACPQVWSGPVLGVQPLQVKPDRCIALHEGQYCYQTLHFSWQTPEAGRYCLYVKAQEEPIACWDGNKMQRMRFEFKSTHSELFFIRNEGDKQLLHEVKVEVAWVYKNRKKASSGWRLF